MFSLFPSRSESEPALVLDIGSGSVGAALALLSRTHSPTVLYTTRESIPLQAGVSGTRLHSLMLRTLAHVMLGVVAEGFHAAGWSGRRPSIREATIVLGAPWTTSQTTFHQLSHTEPLPVSERVLAKLLAEDDKETTRPGDGETVRIEEKLIQVTLDGYETSRPFGKAATDALFTVFSSFAPLTLIRGIEDAVSHSLHTHHSSFHSFSLAAFAAVRELFPEQEHFLLADVSGELTELALVKRQALLESATFPIGKNALIRALREETGVPASGAETFLKLHAEGRATGALAARGEQTVRSFTDEWMRRFTETLASFSEETFLPRILFLTADDDTAPLITRLIKGAETVQFSFSSEPLSVQTVTAETFHSALRWSDVAHRDPFLALETVFGNLMRRKK